MAIIVKMPKLGLEMEQGTVLEWFYEPGDAVSEGDVIAEIESEKSIGEVEAREDGELRRIYIEEGDAIPPGKPIGILAAADDDISELEAEVEAELGGDAQAIADEPADDPVPSDTDAGSSTDQGVASSSTAEGAATQVKASPRAKKQAEELGVDLTTVEGTGPMGSITADDVEAAASDSASATEAESVKASPRAKQRAEELGVDLTTVEGTGPMDSVTEADVEAAAEADHAAEGTAPRRIAPDQTETHRFRRLTEVADPAAGSALLDTTEAVRSAFEERVTTTDLLLVVASAALADEPVVNGTFAESTHQLRERQDIALVTADDDSLTSGVIAAVDEKSLTELVEARKALDGDGDETPSFTLADTASESSGGLLVNRPGVAALELDLSGQRAVPDGDGVELQPLVRASLTYDTHALGQSEAEAFLDRFFERAADASQLVLESYQGKE
ncbi:E3 binding domain-containing protein [Haloarchaeobius sp. TZWWS8]|uniref:E3 binding domain-containing protein n=1 Tax=Haloarchaeobius sp. TZWWS8 TaxID=3446121 RepID=UPI003EB960E4